MVVVWLSVVIALVAEASGPGLDSQCLLVSRSQTQPSATRREGSGQPTVLALVKSLARFLAILVGVKPLINS